MLDTIKDFMNKILDSMFVEKLTTVYFIGFIGLFALIYIVALVVSLCGRLSKIKRAQKLLMQDFSPEQMDAALEKMPLELRYAYTAARNRRANPLAVFNYDACVRTPYSLSFVSRFVKFTVIFALLLSIASFAFFNVAFMRAGIYGFQLNAMFTPLVIVIMALIGAGIAGIISSVRQRKAAKRFAEFSEVVLEADIALFIPSTSENADRVISQGNVDEFVDGVAIMCKEGASLALLKEAAYQLQQMRVRSENLNPSTQHKLNETVNLIVRTMASIIREQQK